MCRSKLFAEWCAEAGKQYDSVEELAIREAVFYDNLKRIELLNTQYKERYLNTHAHTLLT